MKFKGFPKSRLLVATMVAKGAPFGLRVFRVPVKFMLLHPSRVLQAYSTWQGLVHGGNGSLYSLNRSAALVSLVNSEAAFTLVHLMRARWKR